MRNFAAKLGVAVVCAIILCFAAASAPPASAQDHSQDQSPDQLHDQLQTPAAQSSDDDSSTSTDLFIMFGSDFVRPGWAMKANYNIGIGHTFGFLKKDPLGDELTFSYTFEDAGSGFWASPLGSDTESAGLMKNFNLPKIKRVTGYTWLQLGITTFTGGPSVVNRLYNSESLGAIVHFNDHNSIWIQEMLNCIVSVPVYTTTSIGYTRSW